MSAVPFAEAFRFWLTLGFVNFGGPSGQIALMHRELVERRKWITEERFLHALNYCMLLPGPEAQQLAIYIGWLLHGTRGGLAAGLFFILPAFFLLVGLSWLYAAHGAVPAVAAVFFGLRAVVVAIVLDALVRIARRALVRPAAMVVAIAAFVGLAAFGVPFPVIVVSAGLLGAAGARLWPRAFLKEGPEGVVAMPSPEARPTVGRTLRTLVIGLATWWLPLLAVIAWRGPSDVLSRLALFFSKAAMVTFGGAYAVLAYVNQAAVRDLGWLRPGQMMDGLGLAESTPGPLIMVLQFVGFLAAWQHVPDLPPLVAGILGSLVTVWATFAPCFLWIFMGAPYVEGLRGRAVLDGALGAITAAVVGVIAQLALVFAQHTLLPLRRPDLLAVALTVGALLALRRHPMPVVVAAGGVLGLVFRGIIGA